MASRSCAWGSAEALLLGSPGSLQSCCRPWGSRPVGRLPPGWCPALLAVGWHWAVVAALWSLIAGVGVAGSQVPHRPQGKAEGLGM